MFCEEITFGEQLKTILSIMNRVSFTEDWQHKYHFWEYQKVIISTKYVHRINITVDHFTNIELKEKWPADSSVSEFMLFSGWY